MAAPLSQTAAGNSWISVALVGGISLAVCWGAEWIGAKAMPGRWLCAVQWFWLSLIIAEMLHWTMLCWPDYESYHAVPITLLLLAAWASAKGKTQIARAGNVLLWFLIFLFGAVLLPGVKEVKAENLYPAWYMRDAHLVTVLLIPAIGMGMSEKKKIGTKGKILTTAVVFATVTTGVLSLETARNTAAPFYELSRSLRLLGIAERFESLVAAGMTMGYFVLLSYLLSTSANTTEMLKEGKGSWGVWSSAVFSGLFFLSGFRLDSTVLALGTILTWVVLPVLNCAQKNLQKM